MVVWGGTHRLLPLHSGADSSLEPLGRGFEEAAGRVVRPRRAARKARRGMAASLMRERRRVSKAHPCEDHGLPSRTPCLLLNKNNIIILMIGRPS